MPLVKAGVVDSNPMSLYEDSPDREWRWIRSIWAGRARVEPNLWRLYFAVIVDGEPVGMQDLIGIDFAKFGTVTSFSWLGPGPRGRGLGREIRAAVLHLAFAGLAAREATSEAFVDNHASNRVSQALGYRPNGKGWATRRGDAAPLNHWKLTREDWRQAERTDIEPVGVDECLPVLGILRSLRSPDCA